MTISKKIMAPIVLVAIVALIAVPLAEEAFASCWWCSSNTKQMYYKVGYQHPCDNGGKCVTMTNSWQSISAGNSDTLGIYTDKEYSWVRPVVQAETRDLTAHASWSAYTLAVDDNNSRVAGSNDSFSKRYYITLPQSETTFERSSGSAPSHTLVSALITVTQISD